MEVSQGKLCMGFVTPIVNRDAEFPAMQVFNLSLIHISEPTRH